MEQFFKLMEIVDGYCEVHTEWLTKEEADEMLQRHSECFPDIHFYTQQHDGSETPLDKTYRVTPSDACDGWEDIYSHD